MCVRVRACVCACACVCALWRQGFPLVLQVCSVLVHRDTAAIHVCVLVLDCMCCSFAVAKLFVVLFSISGQSAPGLYSKSKKPSPLIPLAPPPQHFQLPDCTLVCCRQEGRVLYVVQGLVAHLLCLFHQL